MWKIIFPQCNSTAFANFCSKLNSRMDIMGEK